MNVLAAWLVLAAAVPQVVAGPDLAERATAVDAPIDKVVVYSDRAKVLRVTERQLTAGVHALRLPDLPGAALLDTLRVGCKQARVLRVEATPVERERTTIEQVETLISRMEALGDQISLLEGELLVRQAELTLLQAITPLAPVPEKERVGRPLPPLTPQSWKQVLDFLERRTDEVRDKQRLLQQQRKELVRQWEQLRREVQRHDLSASSERKIQVVVLLEVKRPARARIEQEVMLPGARWRPRYDLHFDPVRNQVELFTSGLVRQTTGEAWEQVQVALSTAIPGQAIDLPELLTWTLGEKKEFVPRVIAARMPREAERFGMPSPRKTPGQAEQQARKELLQQRLQRLNQLASTARSEQLQVAGNLGDLLNSGGLGGLGFTGTGVGGGGASYGSGIGAVAADSRPRVSRSHQRKMAPPRPSMARAPAAAPPPPTSSSRVYEAEESLASEMEDVQVSGSLDARSAPAAASTSLNLFEPAMQFSDTRSFPSDSPAALAGGLDYVYQGATRVTVPSSDQQVSVPLSVERHPVQTLYKATPALKEVAYLEASVTNRATLPILGGQVNIFVGKDFVGQGELQTTGPGGTLTLPLGADEDIRLKRMVVPHTETRGMLISKEEVTTYTVKLEVGNYKKRPIRIQLMDVLPRSGHEKIRVEKLKVSPAPTEGPDADGVLRWELDVPAGQTRLVELVYAIHRPENWQLRQ